MLRDEKGCNCLKRGYVFFVEISLFSSSIGFVVVSLFHFLLPIRRPLSSALTYYSFNHLFPEWYFLAYTRFPFLEPYFLSWFDLASMGTWIVRGCLPESDSGYDFLWNVGWDRFFESLKLRRLLTLVIMLHSCDSSRGDRTLCLENDFWSGYKLYWHARFISSTKWTLKKCWVLADQLLTSVITYQRFFFHRLYIKLQDF